jgi:coproporphyrinogen III oxidase-like Fe-S oxidoreductase
LNALRLVEPIQLSLFTQRTGISTAVLDSSLAAAQEKGLLVVSGECIETTPLGKQHLNELLLIFS